jgi:hypothetical protein
MVSISKESEMEATDRSILLSKTGSVDSDSFFISIKAG